MSLPKRIKSDVWFVIPAYNEGNRINGVLDTLENAGFENIIVVDDGSRDDTSAHVTKHPVVLLRHPINRGQGAALRTGTTYFLDKTEGKFLVHFDADGQHDIADLYAMLTPLTKGFDITTGSRFLSSEGIRHIPTTKRFLLRCSVLFNYVVHGVRATDAHNGYRALTRKAARALDFHEDRMEHASEIAELIVRKKLRHKEVPVVIHYHEYGQNVFDAIRIGFRLLLKKMLL